MCGLRPRTPPGRALTLPPQLYAISGHGIFARACWGTTITNSYIEDFGRVGVAGPGARGNTSAGLTTFYGIGCWPGEGAASVIASNKVFRFAQGGKRAYKDNGTFVYIGVDRVNYGTAVVSGVGNVVERANSTGRDVGLAYSLGPGAGVALRLLSAGNNVQLGGGGGVPRQLDPRVQQVTPL